MKNKKGYFLIISIVSVICLIIVLVIILLKRLDKEESSNNVINEIEEKKGIERYEANQYYTVSVSAVDLAKSYLLDYCQNALYHPKDAYNSLDAQYRTIRFQDNREKYNEYLTSISNRLLSSKLEKYSLSQKEDYREFKLQDNYGTTYIVKEYAIMDYKIMLDNYTILTDEFKSNYNKANQNTKVMTNIDIFFSMINNKDYTHAYALLDEGFKQKYFSTEADFEKYVKSNFYDYNNIGVSSNRNEGDIFIYNISIKSGIGSGAEQKTKTVFMKLLEGTNFTMSFQVE